MKENPTYIQVPCICTRCLCLF